MTAAAHELAGPTCFCRDCLAEPDFAARRCSECGSPRLVRHRALPSLALAHIDCDAFYATVEKRDNPEFADKPVIIGGGKRGVVSAACYISRTFGVRSAMPMFKALALCPSAIVIRPDMAKYVRVGREVRRAMQALTPLVEPLSIDEAFLDLRGTQRVHGMIPAKALARFAREVERDIGITVSVGLSSNKFLSKIASDLDKPRGFAALDQDEARLMLADKPVGFIFGVGPATQERLSQRGFRTIADLQRADEVELMKQFATEGRRLWRLARGIDDRRVIPDRGAKTISSETTFETDTGDFVTLERMLWRLSEKASARLKGGSQPALVLLHHMDVVPADPKYWNSDPFAATTTVVGKDSMIAGRGALDTKTLGVVELEAFLAMHRAKTPLERDVIFIATADEEAGGNFGAGWLVKNHPEAFKGAGLLLN